MRLSWPLLTAVAALLLVAGAADLARRPYLGFAVRGDRVAAVDAGSPGERAGLQVGDRIVQAYVEAGPDTLARPVMTPVAGLWAWPRGSRVGLIVARDAAARTIFFDLTEPPPVEAWRRLLGLLTAITFLAAGFITWRQRPDSLGVVFLLFCVSAALVFRPPLPPRPEWLGRLDTPITDLAVLVLAASLVHFVHLLPGGRLAAGRRPVLIPVVWSLAALLAAAGLILSLVPAAPPAVAATATLAAAGFVALALLGALVRFLVTLRRTHDRADQMRLRVVSWGAIVGLLPVTLVFILRNLVPGGGLPGDQFAALTLWCLPLAWMYAIVRHRIFDIRLILRRGVVTFVLTTMIAVIWFGLVVILGPRLEPVAGRPGLSLVALIVIALVFTGTRHLVQGAVDRLLFRADLGRRRRLEEFSGRISSMLDPDTLPALVLHELSSRLDSPRGALLLAHANGRHPLPGEPALLPASLRPILDRLDRPATRGELLERAPAEDQPALAGRLSELGWELYVPLRDGPMLHAVAALDLPRDAGGLDSRELAMLRRISRSASEAFTAALRRRDEIARERLAGELEVARSIQRHLLPEEPPLSPLIDLAAITLPGEAVGGDAHDYARLPDGRIGFAVADVAGKGVPAAILMASIQATFRAMAETGRTPGPLLGALNRKLLEIDESDKFVCFFYGLVDPQTLLLRYANAGLELPLVVRADGRLLELSEGGVVLGVLAGAEYEEGRLQLEPGDVILVFSDGLVDAATPEETPIDRETMVGVVRAHPEAGAEQLRTEILKRAGLHGDVVSGDDVTLLVARIY